MTTLNIVEASIRDVEGALSSGAVTTVDLVTKYLKRVALFDCRGPVLNAIPILNPHVFDEAAASDDRRKSGQTPLGLLEGIPYTVKDSYKVKGMTVASGSPAFSNLVAGDDAFTVATIRAAGGVLIGRTNMPPMAFGGMQRGVYGRAETPYGPNKFLAAAWASGSSNGSAASTAASMAVFGMAEETVSSGRSPASNNALVAYTPSRGAISIRGNWPLYPTCDVVVPHTRTVADLARLLDVIAAQDPTTTGDFWRDQPYVKLPLPWGVHIKDLQGSTNIIRPGTFDFICLSTSLAGVRIGVPDMYIGGPTPAGATPVFVADGVRKLWDIARQDLESLGAEIIIVPNFPAVTAYEHPETLSPAGAPKLPKDAQVHEKNHLLAHGWDSFLRGCHDPKFSAGLAALDERTIFPDSLRTATERKFLPTNNTIPWGTLAGTVEKTGGPSAYYDSDYLRTSLQALEDMRKSLLDNYLKQTNCDFFVWPCQGDVAPADADVDVASAKIAWQNGVHYSHGNKALRHLGIPTVTVPMGMIPDKKMPVGLTFAGRAYDDAKLLQLAHAYENKTHHRVAPLEHTPSLPSDEINLDTVHPPRSRALRPVLTVDKCDGITAMKNTVLTIAGTVSVQAGPGTTAASPPLVEITVSGVDVPAGDIVVRELQGESGSVFRFNATVTSPAPRTWDSREETLVPVARDKTMVVILARAAVAGYPSGYLSLV
ncbi:amidase [Ophiostoma piceae UAMH 11346]|uniref:Amidase n=1 Tax=Ophiostoma piceae (strain UAMH 11346) TaxID=1262450 RepID=S3BXC9_OPHP1|nr:amidase [Ophiostoma piceae UAMH 11346]